MLGKGKKWEKSRKENDSQGLKTESREKEKVLSRHCDLEGDQEVSEDNWLPDPKITIHEVSKGDFPDTKG